MRTITFIAFLWLFSDFALAQNGTITNKDGKYGIFDKNHGVIVPPICDEITSKKDWSGMLFILKKDEKYAYAYFRNLDSFGKYGYLTPHWEVSEFVFDELVPTSKINTTIRYKTNDKYGLIFIRTRHDCNTGIFTICGVDGMGECKSTDALYDSPFWANEDNIWHVKLNEKYGFLELISDSIKWINHTYNDWFDTIPLFIPSIKWHYEKEPFYRIVKQNNSWGVVKINTEKKILEYIVPCACDTILYSWFEKPNSSSRNYVFLCEKTAQQKAVIYYDSANSMDVSNINKPVYHFNIFYTDTIPNEKEEKHKKYVHITLGSYDIQSKIFSNKEQCLVDVQSGNTTFYIDDYNITYEFFFGYHGIIIEKRTKTANGITYEYIDHETNSLKLTLKSNKKNISYRMSHTSRHGSTNDYLIIEMIKEKEINKSYLDYDYSYKYYFDFRKKKFFKGKCKGCQ